MKSAITIVATVILIVWGTPVYLADDEQRVSSAEGKLRIFIAESHLEKLQQSLTGMVIQRDARLMLATAKGLYILKGLSLIESVGKRMEVRGLVQQDNSEKCVYVIKAYRTE